MDPSPQETVAQRRLRLRRDARIRHNNDRAEELSRMRIAQRMDLNVSNDTPADGMKYLT